MTQAKKLKRVIRARARKTGESYSVARRQVLKARAKRAPAPAAVKPAAAQTRAARGAISDGAILKKTGHGLEHWFAVLDAFGPKAKGHTDRARYLHDEHQVPGWHSQGIAVAYERARGIRVPNQSCDGTYQVGVSRAVPVSVAEVADALDSRRRRDAWLKSADAALVRALTAAFEGDKPRRVKLKDALNAHVRIPWDGSTAEIRITGKPNGSTTVAVGHINLEHVAMVEERRAQWKVALDALKAHLTG